MQPIQYGYLVILILILIQSAIIYWLINSFLLNYYIKHGIEIPTKTEFYSEFYEQFRNPTCAVYKHKKNYVVLFTGYADCIPIEYKFGSFKSWDELNKRMKKEDIEIIPNFSINQDNSKNEPNCIL